MLLSQIVIIVLCFPFIYTDDDHIILPPDIEHKGPPVCTSSGSLCGIDYRYVTENDIPIDILNSEKEICQCPENITCSSGHEWENMTNSLVYRLFTNGGQKLLVKISYCQLPKKPKRRCGFNQPVLVSRGRGMFMFDMVGDMKCLCTKRPLVPRSDWMEGTYDYVEYGCGQPRCAVLNTDVCSEVKQVGRDLRSRYFCRCKSYEMCTGEIPMEDGQSVFHTCQLMH
ncbi:uncharacterized protein LOC132746724 [Ruditapes philippinarum]|uniref:uncharacterized protein LOC132746724 n=1 Tax=Ruditapes philippinarum TaxID=129788 RepID=UPI00295AD32A|nr:uncharacterized protein LOC132746724 [Ruditapes philippinarum]